MSLTSRILTESRKRALSITCTRHNPLISIGRRSSSAIVGRRYVHSTASTTTTTSSSKPSHHHQRILHSSASHAHSAGAASVHVLGSSAAVESSTAKLPSHNQLKTLFVTSAIPMVGFGFMDNFIMIQAGGYIDATLGVQFGLATLTAAAMGQVVSDVSGVVFGGTLERFLERMKLMKPSNLTAAQRQLPIARNTAMAGAVLGVVVGCFLGATSLLFVDLEAHDRQKRAQELEGMLASILAEDDENEASMGCEECVVYLKSCEHMPVGYVKDKSTQRPEMKLLQDVGSNSLASKCEKSREVCVDNGEKSLLCAPVPSNDGKVLAVLEFHNKHAKRGSKFVDTSFSAEDERTARILARHIAIFMDRLASN